MRRYKKKTKSSQFVKKVLAGLFDKGRRFIQLEAGLAPSSSPAALSSFMSAGFLTVSEDKVFFINENQYNIRPAGSQTELGREWKETEKVFRAKTLDRGPD